MLIKRSSTHREFQFPFAKNIFRILLHSFGITQNNLSSPDNMQSVLTYSCAVHFSPVSLCVMSRNFIVSSGSCNLVIISRLHSSKCMS